jgi:hypothetical protein
MKDSIEKIITAKLSEVLSPDIAQLVSKKATKEIMRFLITTGIPTEYLISTGKNWKVKVTDERVKP